MKCNLCLFLIAIFADICSCQRKISPCSSVFTYDLDNDTSDTWYGTLKLQTSVPLHGVTVDVIFDRRAATFGAYYFNDVSTNDYTEYRIENKNFKLDPGRTLVMNVYVRFENYVPLLKQIRLNGQNICVDLPTVPAVQPIYPLNSNSHSDVSTKRTTRRENPNNFDESNYDTTTYRTTRNLFGTTTQAWNDYGSSNNNNKGRDVYENNFSQFSGHENSRPSSGTSSNSGKTNINSDSNNNQRETQTSSSRDVYNNPSNSNGNREVYNPPSSSNSNKNSREIYNNSPKDSSSNTNNNQGRDIYNQPRETSTVGYGFVADSLANSPSNNNYNPPITQRPFNQQTTTTNYDFNNRRTTSTSSTYQPNRDVNRQVTTRKSTYFQGDLPFFNNDETETSTHSILNLDGDSQCGTIIPKVNPLIVHGEETYQGQFPWHAALYLSEVGSLKYICGGSLVSMNAIVSAAHCVTHEKSKRSINSNNVLVYLGKSSLQKWTGPEQDAKVGDIVINPEYNPERFYGDIAILKLKDSLTRSNFVRPVCLWNFDSDLKLIVNKLGSVPGWGYNENGLVSEDLSYVKMPVVTHETCIWSNRDFFSKVTSEKSFCAGFRNGTSICNGDSGGGMVFKQGKQFYLRGIVSISIALQNTLKCDPNHFAVFVDAAKYTTWIKQNI